jgi:hypothetical protein
MTGATTERVRGALSRPAPGAIEIRCPSIATARSIREDYGQFCHRAERDLRYRTVWLYEDTPEFWVSRIEDRVRHDRESEPSFGQSTLTLSERRRLRQRDGWNFGTKGFHAQACKAIAEYYEISDWTAHYDQELTVDEHKGVYRSVTGEEQTLRQMPQRRRR